MLWRLPLYPALPRASNIIVTRSFLALEASRSDPSRSCYSCGTFSSCVELMVIASRHETREQAFSCRRNSPNQNDVGIIQSFRIYTAYRKKYCTSLALPTLSPLILFPSISFAVANFDWRRCRSYLETPRLAIRLSWENISPFFCARNGTIIDRAYGTRASLSSCYHRCRQCSIRSFFSVRKNSSFFLLSLVIIMHLISELCGASIL